MHQLMKRRIGIRRLFLFGRFVFLCRRSWLFAQRRLRVRRRRKITLKQKLIGLRIAHKYGGGVVRLRVLDVEAETGATRESLRRKTSAETPNDIVRVNWIAIGP